MKESEPTKTNWADAAASLVGAGLIGTAGYKLGKKGALASAKHAEVENPQFVFDTKYKNAHEQAKQIWRDNPHFSKEIMTDIFQDLKKTADEDFTKGLDTVSKLVGAGTAIPAAGLGAWLGHKIYEDPYDTTAVIGSTVAGGYAAKKLANKLMSSKSKELSTEVRKEPMTKREKSETQLKFNVLPIAGGNAAGLGIGSLLAAYADPFENKKEKK